MKEIFKDSISISKFNSFRLNEQGLRLTRPIDPDFSYLASGLPTLLTKMSDSFLLFSFSYLPRSGLIPLQTFPRLSSLP